VIQDRVRLNLIGIRGCGHQDALARLDLDRRSPSTDHRRAPRIDSADRRPILLTYGCHAVSTIADDRGGRACNRGEGSSPSAFLSDVQVKQARVDTVVSAIPVGKARVDGTAVAFDAEIYRLA